MYIYKEKTSGWVIFLRVLFTAAVVYSIYFIFSNSLQVDVVSAGRSGRITALYNEIAIKYGLPILTEHIIRKLAHMAEYAMLGFFLMLSLRVYTVSFIRHISWPLYIGLTTAVTDETIQTFVSGRSGQISDVWVDTAGLWLGIGAAAALMLLVWLLHWVLHGSTKHKFKTLQEIEKFEEEKKK